MQESIDPRLILQSLINPLADKGIKGVNSPTPGTPDAGELWQPSRAHGMTAPIKDPSGFSKRIEENLPGATEGMWDVYQQHKSIPMDVILKLLKEHHK